jgi:uncharacterized protein (TIGR04255 family)
MTEKFRDFDKPPVVETILGVFFRPLEKLTAAHLGLFWSSLGDEFPDVEERAPLEENIERFGRELLGPAALKWRITDRPEMIRLWAKSKDGEHTVQIQRNAILTNWEKSADPNRHYLPYAERHRAFADKLLSFAAFARQHGCDDVVPTSCLVHYINHIPLSDVSCLAGTLRETVTFWTNQTSDGWLPEPDVVHFDVGFPMPDQQGRLYLAVTPATRRDDGRPLLRIDLIARGSPGEPTLDAAVRWLHLGHEWVVCGFASATRPEMHQKWGRQK